METKKILVVDDEAVIRDSIKKNLHRRLKNQNYEIEVADDGSTALEKVKETYFDLILTDINMLKMNGNEFLETMKYDGINHGVILIMSGHPDNEVKYGHLGDKFLHKPISLKSIAEEVENANI